MIVCRTVQSEDSSFHILAELISFIVFNYLLIVLLVGSTIVRSLIIGVIIVIRGTVSLRRPLLRVDLFIKMLIIREP